MDKKAGKKQEDFDAAFNKFSGKLSTEYKSQFKKVEYAGPKKKQEKINQALKSGKGVEFVKKSEGNKHVVANIGQLLNDDKVIEIKEYPKELGTQVSQQRQEKKMSQAQLATKINELESVIKEVESGTGKYNGTIVNKIEKALDFKINRTWK